MQSEIEPVVRIEDGRVVFGMEACQDCNGLGMGSSRKACPTCMGTGLGQRGGKYACKTCLGSGKVADPENPVPCTGWCKGTGRKRANECSKLPLEIWRSMDFFVYRTRRNISLSQFHLNIKGSRCCGTSCHPEHWEKSDTELITDVSDNSSDMQVWWICKTDGTMSQHIGIFLCLDGYAVLPVFGGEYFIGKEFFVPSFRT